ncbi:MAG: DUF1850 domain-containing protein [Paracoccaceae bacterium]|nr:MAG: DUF1850 domain-containing protein [Paracoccaceae bacterium]
MTCLVAGAAAILLAGPAFTLTWTHSVERTEWREHWRIAEGALHLDRAAVRGSGAGMEPGPGAVLADGWWTWSPGLSLPALTLAASGATGAGWRLCDAAACHDLGAAPGAPLTLRPCP